VARGNRGLDKTTKGGALVCGKTTLSDAPRSAPTNVGDAKRNLIGAPVMFFFLLSRRSNG